jgi:hypothetical protein
MQRNGRYFQESRERGYIGKSEARIRSGCNINRYGAKKRKRTSSRGFRNFLTEGGTIWKYEIKNRIGESNMGRETDRS